MSKRSASNDHLAPFVKLVHLQERLFEGRRRSRPAREGCRPFACCGSLGFCECLFISYQNDRMQPTHTCPSHMSQQAIRVVRDIMFIIVASPLAKVEFTLISGFLYCLAERAADIVKAAYP